MHIKDLLDDFNIKVELPQHWYSTEINIDFEDAELIQKEDIIKIKAYSDNNAKFIIIDINDGMSVFTKFLDGKVIGIKYLKNKDDFEYMGKPSDLYYK